MSYINGFLPNFVPNQERSGTKRSNEQNEESTEVNKQGLAHLPRNILSYPDTYEKEYWQNVRKAAKLNSEEYNPFLNTSQPEIVKTFHPFPDLPIELQVYVVINNLRLRELMTFGQVDKLWNGEIHQILVKKAKQLGYQENSGIAVQEFLRDLFKSVHMLAKKGVIEQNLIVYDPHNDIDAEETHKKILNLSKDQLEPHLLKFNIEFIKCAESNNLPTARLLISYGANPNSIAPNGKTLLFPESFSSRTISKEMMALLLDSQANANFVMFRGFTPLMANLKENEKVELLCQKKADVNVRTQNGNTALHFAVNKGLVKSVEVLLAHQADVNAKNTKGETPLYTAMTSKMPEQSRKKIVALLLAKGADANIATNKRFTPLCSNISNPEIIELLCQHKANVDHRSKNSNTALHFAAMRCAFQTVEVLLKNKANPDLANNVGDTALHIAMSEGYTKVAVALLKSNADKTIKNNQGKTAFELASKETLAELEKFLRI